MKFITIDGVSFNYEIKRSTSKKIYIRVKDGVVKVSATKLTTVKEVEEILAKHLDFIKKQLVMTKKETIIHLNGIAYRPRFFVGSKAYVHTVGDEIHLCCKKTI